MNKVRLQSYPCRILKSRAARIKKRKRKHKVASGNTSRSDLWRSHGLQGFFRVSFSTSCSSLLWPLFQQLAAAVRASGRQIKLVELKSPDTVTSGEKSRGAIRVARRENSTRLRDGARAPCVFPLCFSFSLINCLLVQEKFQSDLAIPLSLGDIIMTGAMLFFSRVGQPRPCRLVEKLRSSFLEKKKNEKFAAESFCRERYR